MTTSDVRTSPPRLVVRHVVKTFVSSDAGQEMVALDAMTRETMQDELLTLTMQEPKLVIFVTHSVLEAVFLADRIIVMSAHPGRIMTDIPVPLAHPRDRTASDVTEYVREIRNLLAPQMREDVSQSAAP